MQIPPPGVSECVDAALGSIPSNLSAQPICIYIYRASLISTVYVNTCKVVRDYCAGVSR